MSQDVSGYYARLGVPPTASEAEIKAAYRKLAKAHHPDTRSAPDDGTQFKAIAEAYAVLGSTTSRAEYDGMSATAASITQEQSGLWIEPVACSNCGQVTAQPRFVVFRRVISIVITFEPTVQGIFCAACARKKALRATAVSALAGWWGYWGAVSTVFEGLRNALGGTTVAAANERLLWQNARAFGMRGDHRLALALAEKVRGSRDPEIAARASEFVERLRAQGIELGSKVLNDPWRRKPQQIVLHLLLIAIIPFALIGYFYESRPDDLSANAASEAQTNTSKSCVIHETEERPAAPGGSDPTFRDSTRAGYGAECR